MATFHLPARRLILAGGFTVAVALAPAFAVLTGPAPTVGSPLACPAGETEDPFTYACAPELVPNSPGGGAPSEQALTACSGRDEGECLEGQLYAPAPVQMPNTQVQQSP
jgi:hypothetical protein